MNRVQHDDARDSRQNKEDEAASKQHGRALAH
jgi:hypothetical protein